MTDNLRGTAGDGSVTIRATDLGSGVELQHVTLVDQTDTAYSSGSPLHVADAGLSGVAQDTTVAGVTTSLGTDGSTPPTLPSGSTGVRGWLRLIASYVLGVATAAKQDTAQTSLSAIQTSTGHIPAQGAALAAASLPVTVASDQTLPISASALPLPGGAATAANQATGNTALSAIQTSVAAAATAAKQDAAQTSLSAIQASDATIATNTGHIPVQGTAVTAASLPVNIASDQTVPVSAATLPLPTGAATSTAQATAQTSLSSIVTSTGHIPANGQAAMSASLPVVIASDQSAVKTTYTQPATGQTPTSFTSTSSATVLAANAAAKQRIITNNGAGIFRGVFGAGNTASATSPIVLNPGDVLITDCTDALVGIMLSAGTVVAQEIQ
jgi:hypothetical protein